MGNLALLVMMWHFDDVARYLKKSSTKIILVLLGAKLENNAIVVVMADDMAMQKRCKDGHAKVAMQR